ncbi:MAG: methylaspartate ammonia-lyase [Candidatus Izimaplasma sp.]|nr:methylaspartate ammonia-lyase [Candidatus Izimaplasma bacterium]
MIIKDIVCSKSLTGFYFDDQLAIKSDAKEDGFTYIGTPKTEKFTAVRQRGEALSIMLILEDGQIAKGDAAAVQYSGTGGRDPLFLSDEAHAFIETHIKPVLVGSDISKFKVLAEEIDQLMIDGKRLHTALRYGITQSLLDAAAKANHLTIPQLIRKEYNIEDENYHHIPIFAQSGDERYANVDKMILKEVDVMPHALINNIKTKLGKRGELLKKYIKWLRDRVLKLRQNPEYSPIFHIDVYGTIGIIFKENTQKMFKYIKQLEKAAYPFKLRIEGPVDANNREDTMKALKALTDMINDHNLTTEIVADEWCNTLEDVKYFGDHKAAHMLQVKTPDLGGVNNIIEALIYCNESGIGAYSGGTCNETNVSAEITTNIAIACNATQVLAKPGMGTDEGIMIVGNEMNRTLALINNR